MANLDFKTKVLQRSEEIPVVVDFWAPWCGPCQFLGPVLEELAEEQKERWELVKVNVDENQEVSREYGIRGIPDVKMFYKGEVVGQFTGALPKHQIQAWLEENVPDERIAILSSIEEQLGDNGNLATLENFVAQYPDLAEGRISLASRKIFADPEKALDLVKEIKLGHKLFERTEDIRELARLMASESNGHSQVGDLITAVRESLENGNYDSGLENLIQAVMLDKNYQEGLPRKAVIALFHILGDQHELTRKYRRRFDMALY